MLTIVAGVPAAGKSTMCAGLHPFEFDEWVKARYGMEDVEQATSRFRAEYPASNEAYLDAVCAECVKGDVVLVDTFTYRSDRLLALGHFRARGIGPVRLVYLVASWKTVETRNRARTNPLSEGIVMDLWFNQEFPTQSEGFDQLEIISNEQDLP
jgi:tRNA uridine 5-carbamoylmethylation protein Kti12